jgi:hypothetical protein
VNGAGPTSPAISAAEKKAYDAEMERLRVARAAAIAEINRSFDDLERDALTRIRAGAPTPAVPVTPIPVRPTPSPATPAVGPQPVSAPITVPDHHHPLYLVTAVGNWTCNGMYMYTDAKYSSSSKYKISSD